MVTCRTVDKGPDYCLEDVLKLALHEKGYTHDGKIVPPAYAWTQPDANQIGINLRYAQAGFTLVQEE